MSKRIFLVSNWYGYEDCAFDVMVQDDEPTQEEATEFLISKHELEGMRGYIYAKNTGVEEVIAKAIERIESDE